LTTGTCGGESLRRLCQKPAQQLKEVRTAVIVDRSQRIPHARTARRDDGAQVEHARAMLGNEPLNPQPGTTLAATTRHLQHRHSLGPHCAQCDDALHA